MRRGAGRSVEPELHVDLNENRDRSAIEDARLKEPELRGLDCFLVEPWIERLDHARAGDGAVGGDDDLERHSALDLLAQRLGRVLRLHVPDDDRLYQAR